MVKFSSRPLPLKLHRQITEHLLAIPVCFFRSNGFELEGPETRRWASSRRWRKGCPKQGRQGRQGRQLQETPLPSLHGKTFLRMPSVASRCPAGALGYLDKSKLEQLAKRLARLPQGFANRVIR